MRNRQIVALVLTFGLMVGVAQAQTRTIHRLGGPTRMTNAVYTTDGVAQAFSPIQVDVKIVLTKAGLPALGDRIAARLAAGDVVRTTLPKDTHLEWMAMRGKNGVDITRDIKWSGSALPGYEFIEHEGNLGEFRI